MLMVISVSFCLLLSIPILDCQSLHLDHRHRHPHVEGNRMSGVYGPQWARAYQSREKTLFGRIDAEVNDVAVVKNHAVAAVGVLAAVAASGSPFPSPNHTLLRRTRNYDPF